MHNHHTTPPEEETEHETGNLCLCGHVRSSRIRRRRHLRWRVMIGTVAAVIMIIFTNGGWSGGVMPPTAVPFTTMQDCELARDRIEASDFSGMNGSVNIVCVSSGAI